MATNNNVVVSEFAPTSSANCFNAFWRLTVALERAGAKYYGSGDGTNKDTTGKPQNNKWLNGGTLGATTASGSGAAFAAASRGRITVTGLTGVTTAWKGQYLYPSGASNAANNNPHRIVEYVSATSVKIDASDPSYTPVAESGMNWTVYDPGTRTYPSGLDSVAAWVCYRLGSTIKVPFSGTTTGHFLRGENVVQATTGFQGEVISVRGGRYSGSTGWLVIAPRVRGTGAGVWGLATSYALTGDSSGATVAQNGTAAEYEQQVVFWKTTNATTGGWTRCCVDLTGGETGFSSLLSASGCTATVAPGAGGTGNSFPTYAAVSWGATEATGNVWFRSATVNKVYIGVADLIPEPGYSADGSWFISGVGQNATTYVSGQVHAYSFLEHSTDGELWPYAVVVPILTGSTRTTQTMQAAGTLQSNDYADAHGGGAGSIQGWCNRGSGLNDTWGLGNVTPMSLGTRYPSDAGADLTATLRGLAVVIGIGAGSVYGMPRWIWGLGGALGDQFLLPMQHFVDRMGRSYMAFSVWTVYTPMVFGPRGGVLTGSAI